MTIKRALITASVCSSILGAPLAHAQLSAPVHPVLPTSAGQVQQQMESHSLVPPERSQDADTFKDRFDVVPQAGDENAPAIVVKALSFKGNYAFDALELVEAAELALGKPATLAQIEAAAARVTNFYRAAGYLVARAYVPKQDASKGTLMISIVEGRLEDADVINHSRISDERIRRTITSQQARGAVIEKDKLNRAVMLLNRLPGVGATQAALKAGDTAGTTRLGIEVEDGPLFDGIVATDNYGNTYTGRGRASGFFRLNNPLGVGDQLSLSGVLTQHSWSDSFHVGWDAPVGYDGLRLGVAYDRTSYELGNEFSILDAHGVADTITISASYPLVLTPDNQVNGRLAMRHGSLSDYMMGTKISKRGINAVEASLQGSFRDSILGTEGATSWQGALTYGNLSLDSDSERWDELSGADTAGGYAVLSASLTRAQRLPFDKWSLRGTIRGQVANKNLDSSAGMSLGGPYGVRGYPSGEAQGDEGYVASISLHYDPTPWLTLRAFQDIGKIRVNHSPYEAGLTQWGNTRTLKARGIGFDLRSHGVNIKTDIAWRQGDKAVGDTDRNPYVWVQASWSF